MASLSGSKGALRLFSSPLKSPTKDMYNKGQRSPENMQPQTFTSGCNYYRIQPGAIKISSEKKTRNDKVNMPLGETLN